MNNIFKAIAISFLALSLSGCLATAKTVGLEQGITEIDCSIGAVQLSDVEDRIRAHEGAKELKEAGLALGTVLALSGVGIPPALATFGATLGAVSYPMADLYRLRDNIKGQCRL